MKENEENLNEKYAEMLEIAAVRIRCLKYNIAKGTIHSIEKLSNDIIEQGKDEIELEKLQKEGKEPDSSNRLARRLFMEEHIEDFKLQNGGIPEEEFDKLIESMKEQENNEFHAIDEETANSFDNYLDAFTQNIEDIEKTNNIGRTR